MPKYKAIYSDKFGEETTEISSDGSIMHMTLRGIVFKGVDFEGLNGEIDQSKFQYEEYKGGADLTNFRIIVTFPITIDHRQKVASERITFRITVGDQADIKSQDLINETVVLNASFGQFTSTDKVEDFESALINIQNKLPKGTNIKACVSCKYSTYSPFGNVNFGDMTCFRNIKERLYKIEDKHSLLEVWEKASKERKIFKVQEIFVCPEHEFETKNDWMYKDWSYRVE